MKSGGQLFFPTQDLVSIPTTSLERLKVFAGVDSLKASWRERVTMPAFDGVNFPAPTPGVHRRNLSHTGVERTEGLAAWLTAAMALFSQKSYFLNSVSGDERDVISRS